MTEKHDQCGSVANWKAFRYWTKVVWPAGPFAVRSAQCALADRVPVAHGMTHEVDLSVVESGGSTCCASCRLQHQRGCLENDDRAVIVFVEATAKGSGTLGVWASAERQCVASPVAVLEVRRVLGWRLWAWRGHEAHQEDAGRQYQHGGRSHCNEQLPQVPRI